MSSSHGKFGKHLSVKIQMKKVKVPLSIYIKDESGPNPNLVLMLCSKIDTDGVAWYCWVYTSSFAARECRNDSIH